MAAMMMLSARAKEGSFVKVCLKLDELRFKNIIDWEDLI